MIIGCGNKVKDMSQADFGRLKIELADFSRLKIELSKVKMPGIMACRIEFGPSQPLKVNGTLLFPAISVNDSITKTKDLFVSNTDS
ncbi:Adenosylhomocysteinase [Capsicum chinense]|nr:Adenosylhomocysteinase [Capsicum chinense]